MTNDNATDDGTKNRTLVITLSSVLSVVGAVIMAVALYLCLRNRRLERIALFNRGITPIDDDEIARWKINRSKEKDAARFKHDSNASTSTHRKAPSLIQYQNGGRPSFDVSPASPHSFIYKLSVDLPRTPQSAVLARAPNAREGLTDETVPGDHPFIPSPRRHPSRLYKLPCNSPVGNHRVRGSRSSSIKSFSEAWSGENLDRSPRTSTNYAGTRGCSRAYSSSTAPPQFSFSGFPDNELLTGLSPPPVHRDDIGRAIG